MPKPKPTAQPPEPEIQTDPALHPGPDRNVMLRAVVREVMEMRELGPQRIRFKRQIQPMPCWKDRGCHVDSWRKLIEVSGPTINQDQVPSARHG
jgi:hypothetical protein